MKATTLKQIIASLLLSLCAAHFAGALEPARTTAPAGPYHAGRLNFTTPGGQAVTLFIQFRDGRALASHVLENGKLHSPSSINANVALDNVETLRFDGAKLQGDWKWAPRGAVETIYRYPFGEEQADGTMKPRKIEGCPDRLGGLAADGAGNFWVVCQWSGWIQLVSLEKLAAWNERMGYAKENREWLEAMRQQSEVRP